MIYPTRRAIVAMALGAPLALAVALIQPSYWIVAAAWAAMILAACLADAVLSAPRDRTSLSVQAPGSLPTAYPRCGAKKHSGS